ncbi:uncharacterized protein M437DRAFT_46451 [Aureobasidium melanogenum CBS 110374]|uniref:PB1 domain-containing protein n=1 Tax=Aureobasidium melanogenum (strain CBS 110374) TaxID=1043003 RepID=A0A074VWL0_AURM1|nr:uncharacterized protein M437DRAFT_46451 [Aureobasidium melanogenum CBS 110374]KEQ63624.1 hypothetical protein M437DRAFT_46451 [Aureobasidium melanogenum CBS 110374]
MSTISTEATWVTADVPQAIERANEHNMIVSYTRHRRSADDVTYTYQVPLSKIRWKDLDDQELLESLKRALHTRLDVSGEGYSFVWRMADTDQIAFIRSRNSFEAAILDHKNANKKIIQIFVVSNDSKSIHFLKNLPAADL